MTEMMPTTINGRWTLTLPEHRHARPEWPWWEATRLSAEHHVITGLVDYSPARLDKRPDYRGSRAYDVVGCRCDPFYYAAHTDPRCPVGRALVKRPVVWCVGAEEGDFPALYSSWGAEVVLAEPNPKVWPNIRAIWEANRLRDPLATLAGFFGNTDSAPPDGPHIEPSIWPESADGPIIGDHGFCQLGERPDIPSIRIDTAVALGTPPPDVITMDVEGSEFHVLMGADETIERYRPDVFVSIHPEFMLEHYQIQAGVEKVRDLMGGHGYAEQFLSIDHEHHWWFRP